MLADPQAGRRLLYEGIRRMLSAQVYDVIAATQARLDDSRPANADAARLLPPQLAFSAEMREQSVVLKKFLFQNLYRHPQVMLTMGLARQVIQELFVCYREAPQEMQAGHAARAQAALRRPDAESAIARVVADYIAGMTDRYASREHTRLTGRSLWT